MTEFRNIRIEDIGTIEPETRVLAAGRGVASLANAVDHHGGPALAALLPGQAGVLCPELGRIAHDVLDPRVGVSDPSIINGAVLELEANGRIVRPFWQRYLAAIPLHQLASAALLVVPSEIRVDRLRFG